MYSKSGKRKFWVVLFLLINILCLNNMTLAEVGDFPNQKFDFYVDYSYEREGSAIEKSFNSVSFKIKCDIRCSFSSKFTYCSPFPGRLCNTENHIFFEYSKFDFQQDEDEGRNIHIRGEHCESFHIYLYTYIEFYSNGRGEYQRDNSTKAIGVLGFYIYFNRKGEIYNVERTIWNPCTNKLEKGEKFEIGYDVDKETKTITIVYRLS